jgi:putative acetyltransferase
VQIVPFHPRLAPAFAALNRAWIERLFALEPPDLALLDDPEAAIIRPGGQIFFVLDGDTPVGTVAAVAAGPGRFELAKMAVAPTHQGRGLGEQLGKAVIAWARGQGADTVFLLTNSRLDGAIRLYQRLGFVHRPLPGHTEYARADVYMELVFSAAG